MEVHHPHSAHHGKKFSDYFSEFLMIFLAVTAGFFAETFREHLADSKKEKEYIVSLVSDLQKDTSLIKRTSRAILKNIRGEDSLIHLLNRYHDNDSVNEAAYRYYFTYTISVPQVIFTDRTINQLISSGSMRLINYKISDSIISYDFLTKGVKIQGNYYNELFKTAFDQSTNVFDFASVSSPLNDDLKRTNFQIFSFGGRKLETTDQKILKKYCSELTMFELVSEGYVLSLRNTEIQAERLIATLKHEYHI